jgi:polyribonucleotide nucleotidyltransferase
VVNVGDTVKVKCIGMDDRGKVKLSMKAIDQQTGQEVAPKPADSAPAE